MTVQEIATKLVALCNDGADTEALETLYADNVVSVEPQGSDEMPARVEGIEAVRGKWKWWYENHEIHGNTASGPFIGGHDDKFAVQFNIDVTQKWSGERVQMTEVGVYTLENDKIVHEEFWYGAS